jgi:hypothetical protein
MPSTLLLSPDGWDLMVSAGRDVAVAGEPYALAQDAASAIQLFKGEDYYDITRGIPYWETILGHWPPVRVMKAYFNAAALTVPNVTKAESFISSFLDRRPAGQVQVTAANGTTAAVSFQPRRVIETTEGDGDPSLDFSQAENSQYLGIGVLG